MLREKIFISIAAVGIGLGGFEILLRHIHEDKYFIWPPHLSEIFSPDPEIFLGISDDSVFTTNADGFRSDPMPKNAHSYYLAVGGSTTECLLLDQDEAWPQILQNKLNNQVGKANQVWVGNAGKSGHSLINNSLQVEILLGQFPQIQTVIVLSGINDFTRVLVWGENYVSFPGFEEISRQVRNSILEDSFSIWPISETKSMWVYKTAIGRYIYNLSTKLKSRDPFVIQDRTGSIYWKWRKYRQNSNVMFSSLPPLQLGLEEYWRNLKTIKSICDRRNVNLILITQPFLWRHNLNEVERNVLWGGGKGRFQAGQATGYYEPGILAKGLSLYNKTMLNFCQETGTKCIDLAAEIPKTLDYFYDDVHFTEAGSRKTADYIFKELSKI